MRAEVVAQATKHLWDLRASGSSQGQMHVCCSDTFTLCHALIFALSLRLGSERDNLPSVVYLPEPEPI